MPPMGTAGAPESTEPDTTSSSAPANGGKKNEETETSRLSKNDEQWLNDHLNRIRKLIIDEAFRRARDRDADAARPEGLDVAEAARRFAPGLRFPEPFRERILASLSGMTLVSAALALVFGVIGVIGVLKGNAASATPYFDIVKLFAGAIVGSTGAGVVLASRRK